MKKKQNTQFKALAKAKNGFERLIETREKAKEKRRNQLSSSPKFDSDQTTSSKRIVDSSDINKALLRKREKKSLFDLESDDENLASNFFIKKVPELTEDSHFPFQNPQKSLDSTKRKSTQEVYQDLIRTSKHYKYERAKTKEELGEDIRALDETFAGLQQKLVLSDPSKVRESKFSSDADYFKAVELFKSAELLKPTINRPAKEREKAEENFSGGEEPAFDGSDEADSESWESGEGNFDNPETEDFREKEIDRRLKRLKVDKAEKKLERFGRLLENLKGSTKREKTELSDEQSEVDFDSSDDDGAQDDFPDGMSNEAENELEEMRSVEEISQDSEDSDHYFPEEEFAEKADDNCESDEKSAEKKFKGRTQNSKKIVVAKNAGQKLKRVKN